jgi:hypothetical protein
MRSLSAEVRVFSSVVKTSLTTQDIVACLGPAKLTGNDCLRKIGAQICGSLGTLLPLMRNNVGHHVTTMRGCGVDGITRQQMEDLPCLI